MSGDGRVQRAVRPGDWFPLGATAGDGGTNFAVRRGRRRRCVLCLFDEHGAETRIPLPERDGGVWHGFVPGVGAGQAYGYRATGPYDPARGARCNPAKLLLDPYARAIDGEVRFGPEVLDYARDDPDRPSTLDSAGPVPRSLVVDPAYDVDHRRPPPRRYADTIVYEMHVKGFTATHPDVPAGAARHLRRARLTRRPSPICSSSVSPPSSCSRCTSTCPRPSSSTGA